MAARTVGRLVVELDRELEKRTGGGAAPEAEVKRRLSTIVKACGWKQRSHLRMETLQEDLVAAEVYPSDDLTDMALPLSTLVRFRRDEPPPPGMEFVDERHLEQFLAKNHRLVLAQVDGLEGSHHIAGGTRPQKRYPHGRSYVRPDLVFRTRDGTIVVVEVKLGAPDDRAVTQMRKYLSSASRQHERVRGLIITGRPRSRAQQRTIDSEIATFRKWRVDWVQYTPHMTLAG